MKVEIKNKNRKNRRRRRRIKRIEPAAICSNIMHYIQIRSKQYIRIVYGCSNKHQIRCAMRKYKRNICKYIYKRRRKQQQQNNSAKMEKIDNEATRK